MICEKKCIYSFPRLDRLCTSWSLSHEKFILCQSIELPWKGRVVQMDKVKVLPVTSWKFTFRVKF